MVPIGSPVSTYSPGTYRLRLYMHGPQGFDIRTKINDDTLDILIVYVDN